VSDVYSPEQRRLLLDTASRSIQHGFAHRQPWQVNLQEYPTLLQEIRNTFVTLYLHGEFQGCIGSLRPHAALAQDVARNAFSAAYEDHRGPALAEHNILSLKIQISVLHPPEAIAFDSEENLIAKVRPGTDGLIVEENGRTGTLLPSVWEHLPDPGDFVRHVKLKAGLPSSYWSTSIRYLRYTTEAFSNE
jgi:hypothetical protein